MDIRAVDLGCFPHKRGKPRHSLVLELAPALPASEGDAAFGSEVDREEDAGSEIVAGVVDDAAAGDGDPSSGETAVGSACAFHPRGDIVFAVVGSLNSTRRFFAAAAAGTGLAAAVAVVVVVAVAALVLVVVTVVVVPLLERASSTRMFFNCKNFACF